MKLPVRYLDSLEQPQNVTLLSSAFNDKNGFTPNLAFLDMKLHV